ncbi:50S ribosomal protein L4 [Chlamydiales bacterium]|nr:50S ribosomal protein L4 [Chlamydiales bacterium]
MATLKKYTINGDEIGEVSVKDELLESSVSPQLVKNYILAIRDNQRQWSANTKTRSEVSHSTQKPHPQKGTGRARQGTLSAPQYKGGGRPFGPKPKFDQHKKVNRQERRAMIRSYVAEMIKAEQVKVIDSFSMEAPKTKEMAKFLDKLSLSRNVLFLGDSVVETLVDESGARRQISVKSQQFENLQKSISNLKCASFCLARNLNGYDLLKSYHLVVTEKALEELTNVLLNGGKSE